MLSFSGNHGDLVIAQLANVPRCGDARYTIPYDDYMLHALEFILVKVRDVFGPVVEDRHRSWYRVKALTKINQNESFSLICSKYSFMRYFMLLSFVFFAETLFSQSFFTKADSFFRTYVADGAVRYQALSENPQQLQDLVKEIAELDLSNKRVTPEFLKAFYINTYNLLVIKQVVDHYPIKGPMEVEGFFDHIQHSVMGQNMTLNELEKQTLFYQFPDPRLHFVLVCAAKGCPPLAAYSYSPEELDLQLTERTSEVMNLDSFIRVKGEKVFISKIFDWYSEDFGGSSKAKVGFINKYRKEKIDVNKAVGYYPYDWSLNDTK